MTNNSDKESNAIIKYLKAVSKSRERLLTPPGTFDYRTIVLSLYIDQHRVLSCAQTFMFDLLNHIEKEKIGVGTTFSSTLFDRVLCYSSVLSLRTALWPVHTIFLDLNITQI